MLLFSCKNNYVIIFIHVHYTWNYEYFPLLNGKFDMELIAICEKINN